MIAIAMFGCAANTAGAEAVAWVASRDCTFVNKLILMLSPLVDCSLPTAALAFGCEAAIIILRVSYVVACLLFIFVYSNGLLLNQEIGLKKGSVMSSSDGSALPSPLRSSHICSFQLTHTANSALCKHHILKGKFCCCVIAWAPIKFASVPTSLGSCLGVGGIVCENCVWCENECGIVCVRIECGIVCVRMSVGFVRLDVITKNVSALWHHN